MNRLHILLFLCCVSPAMNAGEGDSSRAVSNQPVKTGEPFKAPKHYFSNTFWFSHYSSNRYPITNPKIDTLGNYSFSQINTAFYIPIWTKDKYRKDSTVIANHHLLLTGNFLNAKPEFSGLKEQHTLFKSSIGLRYIYNNGEKNIWFFDWSPFVTGDRTIPGKREKRNASVLVYNRIFADWFSMKIGFTKTFLFGDRLHLPVIGIRIGRLDKFYGNITFPRSISMNFPIGRKISGSVFVKPMGGIYNFANSVVYESGTDTVLYNGVGIDTTMVIFGRYEYLGGGRLDFTPSKYLSFFISGGVTSNNGIAFASYQNNRDNLKRIVPFAVQKFDELSSFFNFGLTFRFGKTKKVNGNLNMYEVFYINNEFDPGDNNDGPGNGNIPKAMKEKQLKKLSYKDIEDFVEEQDFY